MTCRLRLQLLMMKENKIYEYDIKSFLLIFIYKATHAWGLKISLNNLSLDQICDHNFKAS